MVLMEPYHVFPSTQGLPSLYWEAIECAESGSRVWTWTAWIYILAVTDGGCVTLGKLTHLSQFMPLH